MTTGALSPSDEAYFLFRQNKLVSNLHTMYNELVVVCLPGLFAGNSSTLHLPLSRGKVNQF